MLKILLWPYKTAFNLVLDLTFGAPDIPEGGWPHSTTDPLCLPREEPHDRRPCR